MGLARDDIADVAVSVMTGSGHEGRTYDVTGPEALTMEETAERLTTALDRKITYRAQTPHEVRTTRDTSRLDDMGGKAQGAYRKRRDRLRGGGLYLPLPSNRNGRALQSQRRRASLVRTPRAEPCRLPAKTSGELTKPVVAPLRKAPRAAHGPGLDSP